MTAKDEKNNNKLTPDMNIKDNQVIVTKIVCPISGWKINKSITGSKTKKLKKNLEYKFLILLKLKIKPKETTKNGFNNSMGWNLGKKNKSIHLFDPLISVPIKGTRNKKNKNIKNNVIEILINEFLFKNEKKIIIPKLKNTNTICFKKK